MTNERKAKLFRNGGSQAVRLPAEFRFEGDEIFVSRDDVTGDVILSERPRREEWRDFIAWRNTLDFVPDGTDDYMAERPMNRPVSGSGVFGDEG